MEHVVANLSACEEGPLDPRELKTHLTHQMSIWHSAPKNLLVTLSPQTNLILKLTISPSSNNV